jgi:hypothetical protein
VCASRHFAIDYAEHVNELLHSYLVSTWCYRHEILDISGIATALLITYDDIKDDAYETYPEVDWAFFISRMSQVKPDWAFFSSDVMLEFLDHPDKTIMGWEGRTIYFIKGGKFPEFWSTETAHIDGMALLAGGAKMHGPLVLHEIESVSKDIPAGPEHCRDYEDFNRRVINFLFIEHLGECKLQQGTEPGNEGLEIRDLICSNKSEKGFWADIKRKYSCSETLFEAKNKEVLDRDDLRQTYCYPKPAPGLWGFVICRAGQPDKIHAYNRTLFKNFSQERGVLILSDKDSKYEP